MSTTVTLPVGLVYLVPAFASSAFVLVGQSIVVGRKRRAAKIEYPQVYADKKEAEASADAHIFNCAQRAHQNTLETLPVAYTATLITAIRYPVFAAAALGIWSISRISYTRGYITGEPKKRGTLLSRIGMLSVIGSLLVSAYISGDLLYAAFV